MINEEHDKRIANLNVERKLRKKSKLLEAEIRRLNEKVKEMEDILNSK